MRKASRLTLAWMAAVGALLAVASCTDEDSGPQASSPTGSATEYTAAAQALETAVPGICSNDKTVACATAADCGGSACYLPTAGGQTLFHQVCAETAAGQKLVCTANDIGLVGVTNLQIIKGCDFPGDTAIISFVGQFGLTAQSRHDLGIWIAEDGGDALTGKCSVSNLPTAPAPPWTNLDAVDQPGDTCGDLETTNNPVYTSIQNISLACVDNNGDGFADPTACLTWKQHGTENGLCTSPLDAHPGAPSKCNCQPLRGVALPVPGVIVVDKVTNPVGDPTAFGFALTGGPNNVTASFSLTDTSAPFASSALLPGVYKVKETLPANWVNELAICTSDQGDSVSPDNINLHNGETVKCTFSNQKVVSPPSLTLAKTNDADRNGGTFADVETVPAGAVYPWTVPYRLEIKNNSSFAATLTSITDDKTATLTAPLSNATPDCASVVGTVIEGNATVTCYYEVTFANANEAQVVNTATVVATNAGGTVPTSDSSTVYFTQVGKLSLSKVTDLPIYDAVGQVLTYTLVAVNNGNVTLTGVSIVDPKLGALNCAPAQPVTLAIGATLTCTGSHAVTQADLDAGYFENTALAAGKAPQGQDVSAPPASEIVNALQAPALAVVKTAQPQFYTAAGQVITYTYTVTNSGNVTLGAPIAIDDDRLGLFQCTSATTLAPAQSVTCTQQYTIVAADLNGTYDAKIINYANALAKFGPETVTSPVVQAIVSQTKPTARIAPTDVSCAMFASGAGGVLTTESYMVKNKVINSVAPGVFFYYSQLAAPAASFSVEVSQAIAGGFKPIPVQDVKQVVLYDQACVKSPARGTVTYDMATGLVSFQVTGATVGQVLYLGIKYAPTGLKGQAVPVPSPTVNYTFATALNGAPVFTSWASLAVVPKK